MTAPKADVVLVVADADSLEVARTADLAALCARYGKVGALVVITALGSGGGVLCAGEHVTVAADTGWPERLGPSDGAHQQATVRAMDDAMVICAADSPRATVLAFADLAHHPELLEALKDDPAVRVVRRSVPKQPAARVGAGAPTVLPRPSTPTPSPPPGPGPRARPARGVDAAERARAHQDLRRFVWRTLMPVLVLCATVLGPYLLGRLTRGAAPREPDPLVFVDSARSWSTYFTSDYLAGCALLLAGATVLIGLRVVVALVRSRTGTAWMLVVALLAGLTAVGSGAATHLWQNAEATTVNRLVTDPVPDEIDECRNADGSTARSVQAWVPLAQEQRGSSATISFVRRTEPAEDGTFEGGVCLYAGSHYLGSGSWGPMQADYSISTVWNHFVLAPVGGGAVTGVYYLERRPDDTVLLHAVNLGLLPSLTDTSHRFGVPDLPPEALWTVPLGDASRFPTLFQDRVVIGPAPGRADALRMLDPTGVELFRVDFPAERAQDRIFDVAPEGLRVAVTTHEVVLVGADGQVVWTATCPDDVGFVDSAVYCEGLALQPDGTFA